MNKKFKNNPRTRGKLLGIPTGLEASNENLLQTQSNGNGQNHVESHSEKNMLNLEMVNMLNLEMVGESSLEELLIWGEIVSTLMLA